MVWPVSAASLETNLACTKKKQKSMGGLRTYAHFRFHFNMFSRMYDLLQLYDIPGIRVPLLDLLFFFPWGILPPQWSLPYDHGLDY